MVFKYASPKCEAILIFMGEKSLVEKFGRVGYFFIEMDMVCGRREWFFDFESWHVWFFGWKWDRES